MRLVFMGTPEFAVPTLRALTLDRHAILAVITRPDRPRRRAFSSPAPSPVKAAAAELGLPAHQPMTVREPAFIRTLETLAPESIIVVAFGQILPPEILAIPPYWCINLHASLLPKYRGAAPIARAIMAGESVTGVTTMKMERGLDTGGIMMQEECPIGPLETAGELTSRLARMGADLMLRTLARHAQSTLEPSPQDAQAATLAPPLTAADGRIDWRRTALEIARRVRGCNPWPLGRTELRGHVVQILRAQAVSESGALQEEPRGMEDAPCEPGRVVAAEGDHILVQSGEHTLLALLELRFPGRTSMSARDALNGRLIRLGELFGSAPPS